ncbi:family 10 glycosylhydrolase [Bacillus mangrovi]|uniref:Family 10 glycosylhydrolase n=1 Tax=Metabacillus mangrovi TaxID=1491830 RepID=A0A7X2S565_9BACI|nr:family 10 glycosylhydrolase [Metabacillus mangrovi]MTH53928.1 family 10 glycosylhydrolase [Metabacillus mangrovi]
MNKKTRVITGSVLVSSLVLSSLGLTGNAANALSNRPVNVMTVEDQSGDRMAISGVNQLANDNKLIVFNDAFSYYTETRKGSKEAILEKTGLNEYKVVRQTDGDSAIPESGLVLSTGTAPSAEASKFISQLSIGETIKFYEPVEKSQEKTAAAVDPTRISNPAGAPFDGFRGPDQLIVYTPAFGDSTKTNQYGYEITVENGFVTKLGGGGSKIPKNGFVVSGHGIASQWISANSIIGAKVSVDVNGLVKITQDVDSFAFQSEQAINQAKASVAKAKAEFIDADLPNAELALQLGQELVAKAKAETNPAAALDFTRQATQAAYDAYYYSLPSHTAEQRAIWYRPEETTLEGVKQVLDRMEKAGFNSVYLETTFHGYTIYPSKTMELYGLPAQHPRFQNADYAQYGKDLLKAYVKEGKKRGLSIQAWTDGFMVGESSLGTPSQFAEYPDWAAIQRDNVTGKPAPDSSSKYYWLDIAQPEVQQFMLNIYKEMQTNYDIKGLNIDYMRYPHHSFEKSYGFSTEVRKMYQNESGIDPYTLDPKMDPEQWEQWTKWLQAKENEFVESLHDQSKQLNPKFMMTATPEPGPEAALISDWKNDIDGVIPQAYGHDFNSIQKTVQDSKKLMPDGTMYYTGIYSFYHHLSEMASVDDVMSAKFGTSGVNMFAFGQASAPSVDALGKGPWREKAVNPGEEPILAAYTVLKKMDKQLTSIYLKQGAVSKKEADHLKQGIRIMRLAVQTNPHKSSQAFDSFVDYTSSLIEKDKINPFAGERMKEQAEEASGWVEYAIKHQNL